MKKRSRKFEIEGTTLELDLVKCEARGCETWLLDSQDNHKDVFCSDHWEQIEQAAFIASGDQNNVSAMVEAARHLRG